MGMGRLAPLLACRAKRGSHGDVAHAETDAGIPNRKGHTTIEAPDEPHGACARLPSRPDYA